MTEKRYRLDLGSIIDTETGHILSEIQVRNQLNKYHETTMEFKETAIKIIHQHLNYADGLEGICLGNAPLERAGGVIELLQELGLEDYLNENGIEIIKEE